MVVLRATTAVAFSFVVVASWSLVYFMLIPKNFHRLGLCVELHAVSNLNCPFEQFVVLFDAVLFRDYLSFDLLAQVFAEERREPQCKDTVNSQSKRMISGCRPKPLERWKDHRLSLKTCFYQAPSLSIENFLTKVELRFESYLPPGIFASRPTRVSLSSLSTEESNFPIW